VGAATLDSEAATDGERRGQPARHASRPAALLAVLVLLAYAVTAGCGAPRHPATGPARAVGAGSSARPAIVQESSSPEHPRPPDAPGPGKKFYVSIGDSYAAGYQPVNGQQALGSTTRNGYPYLVAARGIRGTGLTLVNYACSGITTTALLEQKGCLVPLLGPGAPLYPRQTQAQAAIDFIAAHRTEVGLITVIIGGNDITHCAYAEDLTRCLRPALATVDTNLARFLPRLRAAAGPSTPIVGLTYPDVLLGAYLSPGAVPNESGYRLAARSATGFRDQINPALAVRYRAVGATFLDVTAATGAYVPFSTTTQLDPYGVIPLAVARSCELTYYCQLMDIHPRTSGYQAIADLIVSALAP
jgi:lysophospholipase L1-like esterase